MLESHAPIDSKAAGPNPCLNTEKELSPICAESDAFFRTNSQVSANLLQLFLVGAFQPDTPLEAGIAREALEPHPSESATVSQAVLKAVVWANGLARGLCHKTTISL